MFEAITWWFTLQILGLAAVPVAAVIFRPLADRGYAMSKALGMLLVGWLSYTLAMMHVLPFGRLSLALSLLLLGGFSIWLLTRRNRALLSDLRDHFTRRSVVRFIIVAEVLFALAFAVWALFRAYNPEIWATEKFMDYGFMSSMLKSGVFPPRDMWLAGYSINYYYLGYVLMAALTSLSGVAPEIGFNLANVTLYSLTALGSFSVVYNLIAGSLARDLPALVAAAGRAVPRRRARATVTSESRIPAGAPPAPRRAGAEVRASTAPSSRETAVAVRDRGHRSEGRLNGRRTAERSVREAAPAPATGYEAGDPPPSEARGVPFFLSPYLYAVLAALMVVAMGNLTTSFAVKRGPSELDGNKWQFCFLCQDSRSFDWWAPSRVIMDYRTTQQPGQAPTKAAVGYETINEFPAFSFLLADMHPHVMALPLVLLAVLAAYAFSRRRVFRGSEWRDGIPSGVETWSSLAVVSIVIGSLYTANTWDYPTYLLVLVAGLALPYVAGRNRMQGAAGWSWLKPVIVQTALIVVISLLSFLLFHLTFKSLVGGQPAEIPENLKSVPVLGWVLEKVGGILLLNTADKTILGFVVIFGIFLFALVAWVLFEFLRDLLPRWRDGSLSNTALGAFGAFVGVTLVVAFVTRFPLLALLLPLIVAALYVVWTDPSRIERNLGLILFAVAAIIGLTIEIVYLRDVFGNRMNTLFKFYYQMWILWGLAAAFGAWRILYAAFKPADEIVPARGDARLTTTPVARRALAGVWAAAFLLLVASGLMYSINGPLAKLGTQAKLSGLDGSAHFQQSAPGDLAAIKWLRHNAPEGSVLLECCRDEYVTHAGRMSAFTGIPAVLAWDGHENQWRGGQPQILAELGPRRTYVDSIYRGIDPAAPGSANSLNPQNLLAALSKYGVDYVIVGATERGEGSARPLDQNEQVTEYAESVFKQALEVAFTSGSTVVYRTPSRPGGGSGNSAAGTSSAPSPP